MGEDSCLQDEENGDIGRAQKPLRRGDACLACRKRRIRCGAEKPACVTCVRLRKGCVYDVAQRPNRITRLKERIAELEGQVERLKDPDESPAIPLPPSFNSSFDFSVALDLITNEGERANGSADSSRMGSHLDQTVVRNGFNWFGHPFAESTPQGVRQSNGAVATVSDATLDPGMFLHQQSSHPAATAGAGSTDMGSNAPMNPLHHADQYAWPTYAQSTNPHPLQTPSASFNYDFGLLDRTMMDLSSDLEITSSLTSGFAQTAAASAADSAPSSAPLRDTDDPFINNDFITAFDQPGNINPEQGFDGRSRKTPSSTSTGASGERALPISAHGSFHDHSHPGLLFANVEFLDNEAIETEAPRGLLGGWFDPDDVPPSVRDHLLDLYFSHTGRPSIFQPLIHVPRLYTRLTMAPSKRPHQSLMYMMYLFGARSSSQPALRALEPTFYETAQRQIHEGLKQADRLLDVVRALALMTAYLFSKEWYNLGYSTAGTAIRLATACGLHKISSSIFSPPVKFNPIIHFTLRPGGYALEPPEDIIELGERIQAFWAVYELDQCTACAYLWDPGFRVEGILTPLPRPVEDYASGLVSPADDIRLADVLDPVGDPSQPIHTDFNALRLKSLTLLSAAVRMLQAVPANQPCVLGEGALMMVDPRNPLLTGEGLRSAREGMPREFKGLKAALDRFSAQLPRRYRPPWEKWDEGQLEKSLPRIKLKMDTAVLWFIIGHAYMALWDVRSLSAENTVALLVARRIVNIISVFSGEEMFSGYDAFIISIYNEVAVTLLREAKRLEVAGRVEEAKEYHCDVTIVSDALNDWADQKSFENKSDIVAVNNRLLERLRQTSKEDWAAAMEEADQRSK